MERDESRPLKYVLRSDDADSRPQRFSIDYKQELNPSQYEAALVRDGPVLVLAGAGSGKTRTLTADVRQVLDALEVIVDALLVNDDKTGTTDRCARALAHRL